MKTIYSTPTSFYLVILALRMAKDTFINLFQKSQKHGTLERNDFAGNANSTLRLYNSITSII